MRGGGIYCILKLQHWDRAGGQGGEGGASNVVAASKAVTSQSAAEIEIENERR